MQMTAEQIKDWLMNGIEYECEICKAHVEGAQASTNLIFELHGMILTDFNADVSCDTIKEACTLVLNDFYVQEFVMPLFKKVGAK